jgi:hypothetical protein
MKMKWMMPVESLVVSAPPFERAQMVAAAP